MTALIGVTRVHRLINSFLFIALLGVSALLLSEKLSGQVRVEPPITQEQLANLFSEKLTEEQIQALPDGFLDLSNSELSRQENYVDGRQIVQDANGNYFFNRFAGSVVPRRSESSIGGVSVHTDTYGLIQENQFRLGGLHDGVPMIQDPQGRVVVGIDVELRPVHQPMDTGRDSSRDSSASRDSSYDRETNRHTERDGSGDQMRTREVERSASDSDYQRERMTERSRSSDQVGESDEDWLSLYEYHYRVRRGWIDPNDYDVIGDRAYYRSSRSRGSERERQRQVTRSPAGPGDSEDFRSRERQVERSTDHSGARSPGGQAQERSNDWERSREVERSRSADRAPQDADFDRRASRDRELERDRSAADRSRDSSNERSRQVERSTDRSGDRSPGGQAQERSSDWERSREVERSRSADRASQPSGSRVNESDLDRIRRERAEDRERLRDRSSSNRQASRDRDQSSGSEFDRSRSARSDRSAPDRSRESINERSRQVERSTDRSGDRSPGGQAQERSSDWERSREVERSRSTDRASQDLDSDRRQVSRPSGSRVNESDLDRIRRERAEDRERLRDRSSSNRQASRDRDHSSGSEFDRSRSARSDRTGPAGSRGSESMQERASSRQSGFYDQRVEFSRQWVSDWHWDFYDMNFGPGSAADLADDMANILEAMDDVALEFGHDVVRKDRIRSSTKINVQGMDYFITRVGNRGLFPATEWVITRAIRINGEEHHRLVTEAEHLAVIEYMGFAQEASAAGSSERREWDRLIREVERRKLQTYSFESFDEIIERNWLDEDLSYYPEIPSGNYRYSFEYRSIIQSGGPDSGSNDRRSVERRSEREFEPGSSRPDRETRGDRSSREAADHRSSSRESSISRESRGSRPSSDRESREREIEDELRVDRSDRSDRPSASRASAERETSRSTVRRTSDGLGRSGQGPGYEYYRSGEDQFNLITFDTDESGSRTNIRWRSVTRSQLEDFIAGRSGEQSSSQEESLAEAAPVAPSTSPSSDAVSSERASRQESPDSADEPAQEEATSEELQQAAQYLVVFFGIDQAEQIIFDGSALSIADAEGRLAALPEAAKQNLLTLLGGTEAPLSPELRQQIREALEGERSNLRDLEARAGTGQ